jgi:hypothetical protein
LGGGHARRIEQLQVKWSMVFGLKTKANVVGTKWFFHNKQDEHGVVTRNKARLVAKGYSHVEGLDCDETFAPIARLESIRILLAYATHHDCKLYEMDIKRKFMWNNLRALKMKNILTMYANYIRHFMGLNKFQEHGMNALGIILLKIVLVLVRRSLHSSLEKWANIYLGAKYMLMISFFGSTNKSFCDGFSKIMTDRFEMSMMGELKYFLGFQIK